MIKQLLINTKTFHYKQLNNNSEVDILLNYLKSTKDKLYALKNHGGLMKYFTNTSWLLAEKILRITAGLFISLWVARYLEPERFGLFCYAQSFVGLFTALATLGLDGIVVREFVKDKNKRDKLIGTAFGLRLFGAFAVLIIIYIATNLIPNDTYTDELILLISLTTIFQSFNVIDFYFQSQVSSKYIAYVNIIGFSISSCIKSLLIVNEAPLIAFAYAVLFDSFAIAMGYIYLYSKNFSSLRKWQFNTNVATTLIKDSWPLILSGLIISIYMKIDQVMIKEMLDSKAVGQYAAAVRLSEAWYFIPIVISSSLFPAIINAKKQNQELYYERLQKLYDLMAWMSLAIAIPMTLLSDWIVDLLYGGQYNQAGSVLMIHIWAGVFVALSVVRGKWILNENLQVYSFIYLGIGLIVNVICNYFFIQKIGINGAAYATLLSQGIGAFIASLFIEKTRISFYMMLKSLLIIPSIYRYKKKL